jgi:hypothetical protein
MRRTKGWRKPEGVVYVGRPSKWGNPFKGPDRLTAVDLYREHLAARDHLCSDAVAELRGKDLACWCPLVDSKGRPVPCHADVLLEVANS